MVPGRHYGTVGEGGNKVLVTRGGGSGSRRKRVRSGEIRPTEVAVRLWLQLPQRAKGGGRTSLAGMPHVRVPPYPDLGLA